MDNRSGGPRGYCVFSRLWIEADFFLFIAVVLSFVLYEYYALASCDPANRLGGIVLGLVVAGGFFLLHPATVPALLTGIVLVLCFVFLCAFQRGDDPNELIGKHLVGILVIALLISHVIWVRDLEHGRGWIFYLCAVVFAGDTCALYGGKFFGRHRLAPRISPKKTIEGAIAGLTGSCVAGLVTARFGLPDFELKTFFFLSIVLGIAGQVGDLWESALKRRCSGQRLGRAPAGTRRIPRSPGQHAVQHADFVLCGCVFDLDGFVKSA